MLRHLSGLFAGALVLAAAANAGERPPAFDSAPFKMSHNSYERRESLSDQLDEHNCWALELDLCWNETKQEVQIAHDCGDDTRSLADALREIDGASATQHRPTVLWFELKGSWPADFRHSLRRVLEAEIAPSDWYWSAEFVDSDGSAWPTCAELARRGCRFVPVLEAESLPQSEEFFFGVHQGCDPPDTLPEFVAFANVENANCFPAPKASRFVFRSWPSASSCRNQGKYVDRALERGFDLVASNCVQPESGDRSEEAAYVRPPTAGLTGPEARTAPESPEGASARP